MSRPREGLEPCFPVPPPSPPPRTYPMQECLRDGQRPPGCIPGPAVSLCPASPMVRGHKAALWLLLPCGSIGGLFPLRCSSATPGTAPTRARCHQDVEQIHTYPPQRLRGTPGWGQCGRGGGDAAGTAALVPNSEILSMQCGVRQRGGGWGPLKIGAVTIGEDTAAPCSARPPQGGSQRLLPLRRACRAPTVGRRPTDGAQQPPPP